MKRILSLILAVSMLLSVTAFGAITTTEVFTDNETGYTYIFGKFEDGDTNVGFEINGKEYDLQKEDVNNPSKTAFEVAREKGNIFGIGFLDTTKKAAEEKKFSATPFTYNAENGKASQDAIIVELPEYDNVKLADITVNGETITAFSPYQSYYYYETDDVSSITKEDIEATAEAAYANVTVADAGNNNYVITTTAPDSEDAKTVEIRVREKGEYQDFAEQVAEFKGAKAVKPYTNGSKIFATNNGSSAIYDYSGVRIKATNANSVLHDTSAEHRVALLQFDISNITNINDRVILNIPVDNPNISGNSARVAEIGFMAVDEEASISYYPSSNPYYKGANSTDEYAEFATALTTGAVTSTTNTNITADIINAEVANAFAMVDAANFDKDVAARIEVANSDKETKTVDVTDYIKSKLENGDDTATFMVRAIYNSEINSTGLEVCIRPYIPEATLTFTKYDGDVAVSDIKVDGTTIGDFNKDTLNYSVVVEKDTTAIPVVSAAVEDSENLSVEVTQATEIPGAATIKVTAYDGQSETYTVNFDYPFEQGTFELSQRQKIQFGWSNPLYVGAEPNTVTSTSQVLRFNDNHNATYGGMPRETAALTFETTAKGINEDDSVYLTFTMKGYDPNYKTDGVLSPVGVPGGKVRIIAGYSSYTSGETIEKTQIAITNEEIIDGYKTFKVDITDYVASELLKTDFVDGKKYVYLLLEIDPILTVDQFTTGVDFSYTREDGTSYTHQNLGGSLYHSTTYPITITYGE